MTNYVTKKELEKAGDIDTSGLAAKKDFNALKAGADKLDIKKLTNAPTKLDNLKTKLNYLGVGKLKLFL